MSLESWGKLELQILSVIFSCPFVEPLIAHVDGMLIRLHNGAQHLRRLQTLLIHQLLPNTEQLWERVFHNLVKFLPLLSSFESVYAADSQQTLQSRVDMVRVACTEQLKSEFQESRPLLGKVVLQDLLEERNQLGADIWGSRGKGRNQSLAKTGLLRVGDGRT